MRSYLSPALLSVAGGRGDDHVGVDVYFYAEPGDYRRTNQNQNQKMTPRWMIHRIFLVCGKCNILAYTTVSNESISS